MTGIMENSETLVSAMHTALNMSFRLKVVLLYAKRETKFVKH
jgi:hypothetical protein